MISIAIINLKGGVGKSVTACNLAAELAAKSKSVLVLVREGVELDNEEHHLNNEAPSLAVVKKLISFADLQGGLVASVEEAFMEFYGKNGSGRQALQAMKTMLSESGLMTPQSGTLTATES